MTAPLHIRDRIRLTSLREQALAAWHPSEHALARSYRAGATSPEEAREMARARVSHDVDRLKAGEMAGAWNPHRVEPLSITPEQLTLVRDDMPGVSALLNKIAFGKASA